jgi:cysteinyl-tRNA synthetase
MIRLTTVLGLLLVAAQPAAAQVIAPTAPATRGLEQRAGLGEIRSWGYQLQRANPERVAASPFDLVVVDYSHNGTESGRFSRAEVERMRKRPDGGRRVVLAYLSIGEAEDYRYYWNDAWIETVSVVDDPAVAGRSPRSLPAEVTVDRGAVSLKAVRLAKLSAPAWLGRENERWPGNFLVRYWDPAWQAIVFGAGDSYLTRIIEAGFDGVFLDRIDTFQTVAAERPEARQEMVRFVIDLARRARASRPGFLVVPQNGEQLLADPAYLGVIDAVAKEDLIYGEEADGRRNPVSVVSRSMRWLAPAVNRGVLVLVVEYIRDRALAEQLRGDIERRGFVPYFGVRALDRLVYPEDLVAASQPAAPQTAHPTPPPAAVPQAIAKERRGGRREVPLRGPR